MFSLLLRNLVFTILQPGLVAGLIPYLLLRFEGKTFLPDVWTIWQFAGIVLMISGFLVLARCILRFAVEGKGTLSPIDPTKSLFKHNNSELLLWQLHKGMKDQY